MMPGALNRTSPTVTSTITKKVEMYCVASAKVTTKTGALVFRRLLTFPPRVERLGSRVFMETVFSLVITCDFAAHH